VGIENLRGAIISHEQMMDLAPLLAAQLGVVVLPDVVGAPDIRHIHR